MIIFGFLWTIVCAIANRIRGGWLSNYIIKYISWWSTTPARIFVSSIISTPVYMTRPLKEALLFNLFLYVGFIFRWYPWNVMLKPIRDITLLSLRGLLITFPAGLMLGYRHFAFCGLLMGIIYFISWKVKLHHVDPNGYEWNGSDWGELFFGYNLGLWIIMDTFFNSY